MEQIFLGHGFSVVGVICDIFFGGRTPLVIVTAALFMAGVWKVFEKSGLKGYWALFPGFREYHLALCADREAEGRPYAALSLLLTLLNVFGGIPFVLMKDTISPETAGIILLTLTFTLALIVFIYSIRVYRGLIDVYGVKRRWLFLWIIPYLDTVAALLWGFSKKFRPLWKVQDIKDVMAKLASGGSVSVMDDGLTVNLKERSVREFFQKKVLLRDIHMAIPQGRLVLLLGGSGAGKTTFLNAVNGFEKANAQVVLNGTDMYRHYNKMLYEVGFVPQQDMMRGKDTVIATLDDAARMRLPLDFTKEQRRMRVNGVMDIFGLRPVKNNLVEKLSGGQRKRLSIAMEFLSNPSLFILDEPDSGLDGVMARELFVQLRAVADKGRIVIVITHTPDRVIDLFDDVIVLAKDSARTGRLAFYGSIDEARKFFGKERMEEIVKAVNREEEGGEGKADEYVMKYAEVLNG